MQFLDPQNAITDELRRRFKVSNQASSLIPAPCGSAADGHELHPVRRQHSSGIR
jgi:hypothetical protein